jgi:hypothetical protein
MLNTQELCNKALHHGKALWNVNPRMLWKLNNKVIVNCKLMFACVFSSYQIPKTIYEHKTLFKFNQLNLSKYLTKNKKYVFIILITNEYPFLLHKQDSQIAIQMNVKWLTKVKSQTNMCGTSCIKMPQMISNFNHKIFLLPYLYDGISMFVEWFVACWQLK